MTDRLDERAKTHGDIDHEYTDEIVCPHCGYKHSDSWEWFLYCNDDVHDNCAECGKPMIIHRHVSITYLTRIGQRCAGLTVNRVPGVGKRMNGEKGEG